MTGALRPICAPVLFISEEERLRIGPGGQYAMARRRAGLPPSRQGGRKADPNKRVYQRNVFVQICTIDVGFNYS
jgi:hypothetical protein